jgi:ATP-binding cassette, subfamily B, bacterial PglK
MSSFWRSTLGRAINVLSQTDRHKIVAITVFQILITGLDLLGVIAIGLLGALAVTGLQSSAPGDQITQALTLLRIRDESFQTQAVILGIGAVVLLVGRTLLSILFTKKVLFFLSRRGAKISADLISRLMSQPLLVVQSRTTQETVFAVTRGVVIIVIQVLATAVVWISDLALLIVMVVGLLIIDLGTALAIFLVFFLVKVMRK